MKRLSVAYYALSIPLFQADGVPSSGTFRFCDTTVDDRQRRLDYWDVGLLVVVMPVDR